MSKQITKEQLRSAGFELTISDDGTTPPPSSGEHATVSPVGDVVDDLEHEVPDPGHPMAVARKWLDQHHTDNRARRLLRHHRNTFWAYDGAAWPEVEERRLLADLYGWLEDRWYWKKTATGPVKAPFHPTRRKMADLAEGLKAHTHLDQVVTPPAWLDGTDRQVIPLTNGLLNVTTRELTPHTPDYFSPHVLPFAYGPEGPTPRGGSGSSRSCGPTTSSRASAWASCSATCWAAARRSRRSSRSSDPSGAARARSDGS